MRELSHVLPFCQFCHFLVYNSVRFIYISVTSLFTCFFPACLLESTPCHFYPAICAICGILLILNDFFLPKRLPKLATLATKMASPWFLKGFFIVKCVMSLFYSALLQIVILTSITCYYIRQRYYIRQCYYIRQRYYVKLFNTHKTLKLKTVKKQSFINYFKIFYDFLKKSLDLMRLLLHNTPNNKRF